MTFMPPGIMSDLRAVLNSSLTSTAVIPRTSATLNCRVEPLGSFSFPEFGGALAVPEYNVQFANGVDVQAGDRPTVDEATEYVVLEVPGAGATYSTATDTRNLALIVSTDGTKLPARQNATVTLTSKLSGVSITAAAILSETSPAGSLGAYADEFKWTVMISPQLNYGDGNYPQQGDAITWQTRQSGATKTATLSKSHPPHTLYLPVLIFLFNEND